MNSTIYFHVIILITKENFTFKEKFRNRPNNLEFKEIMTSKNKYNLQKLCRFVVIINKGVCPPSQPNLKTIKLYIYYVNIVNSVLCIFILCWFRRLKIYIQCGKIEIATYVIVHQLTHRLNNLLVLFLFKIGIV